MNYAQMLAAVNQSLAEQQAKIGEIMSQAVTKGATPDEAQEAKIKALEAEIEVLEANAARLEKLVAAEKAAQQNAEPVQGDTPEKGKNASAGIVKAQNLGELEKGIAFAQYARAKMYAALELKNGNYLSPVDAAKQLGYNDSVVEFTKAALGTTTDTGFAKPLVEPQTYTAEFVELLRNASVFDKLKGFHSVPFNVKINGQLTGGIASWVGEGEKKPLTNPTFGQVEVGEHKLAAITVYTQELLRRADPAIDKLIRDDLIAAATALVDKTFLDDQAKNDTRPAGILNGATKITSTGDTADKVEADLLSLLSEFAKNNLSADNSYFIMSETRAMKLALLRDALGRTYFEGMAFAGGSRHLLGVPVVTSQAVGNHIILVKMSELLVAQDGGVDVSFNDTATLVDGANTHNLWQENKLAVRVERFITWAKRRPLAAAYIEYTN